MKASRESDVGLRRVGTVGLGNMARQDFERGRSRWCRGMAHHCQAPHGHGIATPGVSHGDNCEVQ